MRVPLKTLKNFVFPNKKEKKKTPASVNPTGKWEEITKDFGPDQIGFGVLLKLRAIITQKTRWKLGEKKMDINKIEDIKEI